MPGRRTEIPQAARTVRNMRVECGYFLGVPGPITNGGLNEHGVAVRDIWSPSRQELRDMTPKDQAGPTYSDLARIVVERARTAREGVELIGALIAEHGYSTYGGNSHMIADPEEAWVVIEFAGGRGLWVAERLGPDSIRAARPGHIGVIPAAPDDDFLFPAHFFDTAIERGWHDPAAGGPFDVNAVYGDGKGPWAGVRWVEREMRERAARPEKIGLEDMFWAISTERLTGDTAGYGQVVPLTLPKHDALRIMWHAPVGPVTAPLLPVFLGQDEVPAPFRKHRYLSVGESHRFLDTRKLDKSPDTVSRVPQGVETGETAVYHYKRLMHLAFQKPEPILREVWVHWRGVERDAIAALPDVLRRVEVLLEAGEGALARRDLETFSCALLNEALGECRVLSEAAHIRLRRSGDLNLTDTPKTVEQLW